MAKWLAGSMPTARVVLICCSFIMLLFIIASWAHFNKSVPKQQQLTFLLTVPFWMPASPKVCVPMADSGAVKMTMSTFYRYANHWYTKVPSCRESLLTMERIYDVTHTQGSIAIDTDEFRKKLLHWLGDDQTLYKEAFFQNVTSVYNRYTHEETIFNPLRGKRPVGTSQVSDLDYIEDLQLKTKDSCDFCRYKRFTARDVWGRLESPLAVAAANSFRYAKNHQLILSRSHHPLNWSREEFNAMFNLSHKWFKLAHQREPTYNYPVITWDLLPHGGASQVHPHLQLVLKSHRYPGNAERWRQAAQDYYRDHKRNYFTDLISAHDSLGLTVRYKSAVAIATLTPKKDNEVIIICQQALPEFYELLYFVIRAYIEDKKVYPFSMTAALPPIANAADSTPAFIRIVTRGKPSEVRSDISSLELFTFNNVMADPFKLIMDIRSSVDKRQR